MQEQLKQEENIQNQPTKTEIAAQKKEKFVKLVKKVKLIIFAILFLAILLVIARSVFIKTKKIYTIENKPTIEPVTIIDNEELPKEEPWEKFVSETNRFEIMYPPKDKFTITENSNLVKIVYEKTIPEENINWDTLVNGYFVTINTVELAKRTLSEAALLKYEWYKNNCPSTSNFGPIEDYTLNTAKTKKFQIQNCNSDIIVIFANKNNLLYEFTLVTKGDIGYKQHFQTALNQIRDSFIVYFDAPPTPDPYIIYKGEKTKITFKYPRVLDTNCCHLPIPTPNNKYIENVMFFSESDMEHALAIFIDKNSKNPPYNEYISSQVNILADDFRIIKGYSPTGSKEESEINNHKLVKLSNYYWRGDDVYYLKSKTKDLYLIIVKTAGFNNNIFYGILDSIVFD